MTDPKLIEQARQGSAIALTTLLNRSLQSQGVWARLETGEADLQIGLESTQAPDPETMVARIRAGLMRLQPRGIRAVTLRGWALGETQPSWERHLVLATDSVPRDRAAAAAPPPTAISEQETIPFTAATQPTIPEPLPRHTGSAVTRPVKSGTPPRSRQRRRQQKPLVLKWSDFDPMMLAIIGFVAVYGFCGSLNPSYDGPFIWLHYPDLAIHETGHLLFMPFGIFLMLLGGSLTQIAFPAVFTGYFFYSRQLFSSALTLFWTGQNFMDVSVYMRDAPVRQLPLTVDNIDAHDWWQLFSRMNCMHLAEEVANVTHGIGVLLYVASVIAGVYLAYRHRRTD